MLQSLQLAVHSFCDLRLAVPARNRGNAGQHVQIAASRFIEEVLEVPFHDHERFAVKGEDGRIAEALSIDQNLLPRGAVVNGGPVVEGRKFGCQPG